MFEVLLVLLTNNQPRGVKFHTSLLIWARWELLTNGLLFHCSFELMKIVLKNLEDWAPPLKSHFYIKNPEVVSGFKKPVTPVWTQTSFLQSVFLLKWPFGHWLQKRNNEQSQRANGRLGGWVRPRAKWRSFNLCDGLLLSRMGHCLFLDLGQLCCQRSCVCCHCIIVFDISSEGPLYVTSLLPPI